MLRKFVVLLALASLSVGFTQRPLTPPNYYLSQLEEVEVGSTIYSELSASDGQNFKDGSYLKLFTLQGRADQSLRVQVESDDFDAYLTIFSPDGTLLAANDDSDGSYEYSLNPAVSVRLPEDGAYLVVVSGYSALDVGSFSVSAIEVTSSAVEMTVPGVIEGASLDDSAPLPLRTDMWGHEVRFHLDQSRLVLIDLSAEAFDAMILVYSDDGELMGQNDDRDYSEATGYSTDAQLLLDLPAGGYSIYVTSWFEDASGDYTLQLRLLEELR